MAPSSPLFGCSCLELIESSSVTLVGLELSESVEP